VMAEAGYERPDAAADEVFDHDRADGVGEACEADGVDEDDVVAGFCGVAELEYADADGWIVVQRSATQQRQGAVGFVKQDGASL